MPTQTLGFDQHDIAPQNAALVEERECLRREISELQRDNKFFNKRIEEANSNNRDLITTNEKLREELETVRSEVRKLKEEEDKKRKSTLRESQEREMTESEVEPYNRIEEQEREIEKLYQENHRLQKELGGE